jgi:hypothetical protein
MKHFIFQILDVASALGKAASSAHPAGALAHLGESHPDRTVSPQRPSSRTRAQRPSTTEAQPAPSAPPTAPTRAPAPTPAPAATVSADPARGRSASPVRAVHPRHWPASVALATATVLVVLPLSVPPASAREAVPAVTSPAAGYAEPLSTLGGRTLAQYVADHQPHVLGPVRG